MFNIICPEHTGGFASNTYIFESSGEAAIIDPTVPYDASYTDAMVKYIFITHAHFDHILEVKSWADNTGAPVYVSASDDEALRDPVKNCYKIFFGKDDGYFGKTNLMHDGDRFIIGDEELSVLETPGHTPGSVVLYNGDVAFVGDTVFAGGGYGRWDLPGGDYEMLRGSIRAVMALDENTVLYPGHGGSTTVKEFNCDIHLR